MASLPASLMVVLGCLQGVSGSTSSSPSLSPVSPVSLATSTPSISPVNNLSTLTPSLGPDTTTPSLGPIGLATSAPSLSPIGLATSTPSLTPVGLATTSTPSLSPLVPTATSSPSVCPTLSPGLSSTGIPSSSPSGSPIAASTAPSQNPSQSPSLSPSLSPFLGLSASPSASPTSSPTSAPIGPFQPLQITTSYSCTFPSLTLPTGATLDDFKGPRRRLEGLRPSAFDRHAWLYYNHNQTNIVGFNTAQFGLPVVTVIPSSQPRDDDSCGETCIGITVGLVAFFGLLPLAGFLIYMFAIRGDEARIYRGKTGGMSGIEETLSAAQELREERKEASTGTDIY
eukprot:jgi/Bigna1/69591/fgenesh1_pg.9_\